MASERNAKAISEDDVTSGLESLMASEVDLFENLFRSLPESQRLVARAIAKEPVAVFSEDYRCRHSLPSISTVNTAVRRLVNNSHIDMVEGLYRHMDPLFAAYLRKSS